VRPTAPCPCIRPSLLEVELVPVGARLSALAHRVEADHPSRGQVARVQAGIAHRRHPLGAVVAEVLAGLGDRDEGERRPLLEHRSERRREQLPVQRVQVREVGADEQQAEVGALSEHRVGDALVVGLALEGLDEGRRGGGVDGRGVPVGDGEGEVQDAPAGGRDRLGCHGSKSVFGSGPSGGVSASAAIRRSWAASVAVKIAR